MTASQRQALLDAATDEVLARGLIGLTLRPLAAAIGTSDRMLIYHFGSRDALVSAIVARASERSVRAIDALAPARTVRAGVLRLWTAYGEPPVSSCLDVYCQAAATGLLGREPYLSDARASNAAWSIAVRRYLVRCGAPPSRAARVVRLVDSALYGFHLDLITERAEELGRGVADLADAAQALVDARR